MSKLIVQGALAEWKYVSNLTVEAVEAFPEDMWDFSPGAKFGTFAKQVRHVVCCRGVFADGLVSCEIDFGKKHNFYLGSLSRGDLIAALNQSAGNVQSVLASLESENLDRFRSSYYGELLTFVEHFSALTCHEALHRGQWQLYAALAKKEI